MSLDVDQQIAGLTEAPAAERAAVGPLSGVNALVSLQCPGVTEAPAAARAAVRFLSGVNALVHL